VIKSRCAIKTGPHPRYRSGAHRAEVSRATVPPGIAGRHPSTPAPRRSDAVPARPGSRRGARRRGGSEAQRFGAAGPCVGHIPSSCCPIRSRTVRSPGRRPTSGREVAACGAGRVAGVGGGRGRGEACRWPAPPAPGAGAAAALAATRLAGRREPPERTARADRRAEPRQSAQTAVRAVPAQSAVPAERRRETVAQRAECEIR
jgi:hypothetical protein